MGLKVYIDFKLKFRKSSMLLKIKYVIMIKKIWFNFHIHQMWEIVKVLAIVLCSSWEIVTL